jgi:hypothetical protein
VQRSMTFLSPKLYRSNTDETYGKYMNICAPVDPFSSV